MNGVIPMMHVLWRVDPGFVCIWGRESPVGLVAKVWVPGNEVSQKFVIFCKLCYCHTLGTKAKQHFVFWRYRRQFLQRYDRCDGVHPKPANTPACDPPLCEDFTTFYLSFAITLFLCLNVCHLAFVFTMYMFCTWLVLRLWWSALRLRCAFCGVNTFLFDKWLVYCRNCFSPLRF